MDDHVHLTRRERQIMDALHRTGRAGVAEIGETLGERASYNSIRVTLSTIIPYRIERAPAELLPAMPPMVARLEVDTSTGKKSPCGERRSFR